MPKDNKNITRPVKHQEAVGNIKPTLNSEGRYTVAKAANLTTAEIEGIINTVGSEVKVVGPSKSMLLQKLAERQTDKEAEVMGLSDEETTQRDQAADIVMRLDFRSKPDEFQKAQLALTAWEERHAEDPGLDALTKIYETMKKGADLLK